MNEMNYELENMNAILFNHADINKLILAENEDLNNFVSKSILYYILSDLNHDIVTDYHIVGIGNVDLYDLSTRTIYAINSIDRLDIVECQKNIDELYPDSEVGVIAINTEDLPSDIFQRYIKLREYVISI
jgi:hypothetical protein